MSTSYHTPGVYVAEIPAGPRPIQAVGTSTAVFIGDAPLDSAFVNQARAINNWSEFLRRYTPDRNRKSTLLSNAVYGFFDNGGTRCFIVNTGGDAGLVDALAAAAVEDEIAIVAAPGLTDTRESRRAAQSLRTARGPGCDPRHARGGRRHRAPYAGRDGAGHRLRRRSPAAVTRRPRRLPRTTARSPADSVRARRIAASGPSTSRGSR